MNRDWLPCTAAVWRIALAASCAAAMTGCSNRDAGRHRVSGRVDFEGSPVPAARIYFEPDNAKGNRGPTGYAIIRSGSYDTAADGGRGAIAGPAIVRIDGAHDPAAVRTSPQGEADGILLFPEYRTVVDLPAAASLQDFNVPSAGGKSR